MITLQDGAVAASWGEGCDHRRSSVSAFITTALAKGSAYEAGQGLDINGPGSLELLSAGKAPSCTVTCARAGLQRAQVFKKYFRS